MVFVGVDNIVCTDGLDSIDFIGVFVTVAFAVEEVTFCDRLLRFLGTSIKIFRISFSVLEKFSIKNPKFISEYF